MMWRLSAGITFLMALSTLFVLLLSIAMATALVARLARLPYPVALVIAGLGLGTLGVINPPHLTKELLFSVFLPGLLFEAAFHLDFEAVLRQRVAIAVLAIPGVLAAITITAAMVGVGFRSFGIGIDFGFAPAFIFGALVAATDPVAVSALFRALHAPADLSAIIEGESLLNDGTSVVFLSLIIAAATGGSVTAGRFAGEFVLVAGGGAVIGAAVGAGLCEVIRRVDDAMIEITITMIAAYGSFVVAEQCHASGVIATVVAGMFCGVRGRRAGMSPNTRAAVTIFWEYVAFALNSVVFLLIGFEVAVTDLMRAWPAILIAYVAMMLARAVVVFGFGGVHRTPRIPRSWLMVITWAAFVARCRWSSRWRCRQRCSSAPCLSISLSA